MAASTISSFIQKPHITQQKYLQVLDLQLLWLCRKRPTMANTSNKAEETDTHHIEPYGLEIQTASLVNF